MYERLLSEMVISVSVRSSQVGQEVISLVCSKGD